MLWFLLIWHKILTSEDRIEVTNIEQQIELNTDLLSEFGKQRLVLSGYILEGFRKASMDRITPFVETQGVNQTCFAKQMALT